MDEVAITKRKSATYFVSSHNIHLDGDYASWIADVKLRYRNSQTKAAFRVNVEKLLFNWQLGRDLVQKKGRRTMGLRYSGAGES